jgi:hypothetical protein
MQATDFGSKAIVFSQFVNMLDVRKKCCYSLYFDHYFFLIIFLLVIGISYSERWNVLCEIIRIDDTGAT